LEGPGAKAAEFTSRATRRPGKLTEEGNSRITDTTTGFKCKSNETIALGMTTRLPLAILGLRSLIGSKAFLGRRLGMGSGVTRANVTHDVREAPRTEDDNVRAKVVEDLMAIDFHFGTAAGGQTHKVGGAHQRIMPEAGAVFGGGVAGHSVVTPVVDIGFVARWAAAGLLFLLVG
jgi:hypothetical protein